MMDVPVSTLPSKTKVGEIGWGWNVFLAVFVVGIAAVVFAVAWLLTLSVATLGSWWFGGDAQEIWSTWSWGLTVTIILGIAGCCTLAYLFGVRTYANYR